MENKLKLEKSFTFVELVVVMAILAVLLAISLPVFIYFDRQYKLNDTADLIINDLMSTRNMALASEGSNKFGIYFDNSTSPQKYIVFKGDSFSSRDISFDRAYQFSPIVRFSNINLNGGNEIVFNKMVGITNNPGSISLQLSGDSEKTKTIYVDSFGQIGFNALPVVSDEQRVKDSRHIHLSYNRLIETASEKIILNFDSGANIIEIPIALNLLGGQIKWEGEIDVGGVKQTIKIKTLALNGPATTFCIYRDRNLNNKSLEIALSVDVSGSLINYSADGLTTNSTSFYAEDLSWQ